MENPFQKNLIKVLESNNMIAEAQRWSNFLITINTNVKPRTMGETLACTNWLILMCEMLFGTFEGLNGTVLKPAGAPNDTHAKFEGPHLISGVAARVTIEQGNQQGRIHAHILLEVCHHYTEANSYGLIGIHINRTALHQFLKDHLHMLALPELRRPASIYVDCKLLTTKTDNSNKFLTMAYINKDRAKDNGDSPNQKSLDLRAQYASAPAKLQHIYDVVANNNNVIFETQEEL